MKKYLVLLFALFVLVSCSEAGSDAPSVAPTGNANEDVAAKEDQEATPKGGGVKEPNKKKKKAGAPKPERPNRKGAQPSGGDGAANVDDGGDQPRNAFNDSGSEDDGSSAAYPAPGDYVFAQSGFEKFCAGGSCERQALAKQQTVRITLASRSGDGATLVSEASSSDDRVLRTTTDYTRSGALITDVYTRLTYQGFAFENDYRPAPPVESLRFPLQDGASWRGSWKDSTSGDYAVQVFGPTSVNVGGRAVRAFQVATTTQFRGEFNGKAKTLAWIDPATKAVVKISGSADLNSTYGRYVTEFSNALRSGPGY